MALGFTVNNAQKDKLLKPQSIGRMANPQQQAARTAQVDRPFNPVNALYGTTGLGFTTTGNNKLGSESIAGAQVPTSPGGPQIYPVQGGASGIAGLGIGSLGSGLSGLINAGTTTGPVGIGGINASPGIAGNIIANVANQAANQNATMGGAGVAPISTGSYATYSGAVQSALNAGNVDQAIQGLISAGLNAGKSPGGGWYVDIPTSTGVQRMTGQAAADYLRKTQLEEQLQGILGKTQQPTGNQEIPGFTSEYQNTLSSLLSALQSGSSLTDWLNNTKNQFTFNPAGGMPGTPTTPTGGVQGGASQVGGLGTPGLTPTLQTGAAANLSDQTISSGGGSGVTNYLQSLMSNIGNYSNQVGTPNVGDLSFTAGQGVGNLAQKQEASNTLLKGLTDLLSNSGQIDEATRNAILAPAAAESKKIQDTLGAQAKDYLAKQGLMNTGNAITDAFSGIAGATAEPLIQAQKDVAMKQLEQQQANRQTALEGLGQFMSTEGQLAQGDVSQKLEAQKAQANFNLDKAGVFLKKDELVQNGQLTARAQDIDKALGAVDLQIKDYLGDEGLNVDKMRLDMEDKWKDKEFQLAGRNMTLTERKEMFDEWGKSMGLQMDAFDRQQKVSKDITDLTQKALQGDQEAWKTLTSLKVEQWLTNNGIDATNARWAGEIAYSLLNGREDRDQEMEMFLRNLDAQTGGGGLGGILGSVLGGVAGSFLGGAGAAAGAAVGNKIAGKKG